MLADLLEIQGANTFRVRAYREAARTIDGLPRGLAEMVAEDEDLSQLPGIGESMADKIEELVHTGSLQQLKDLDILVTCKRGSLDLDDEVLAELDVVVCSIHSKFDLPADKQTERVIRAMDHPHFSILAHPTGRMIGQRQLHQMDVERTMKAALERGCFLELNAQPERLDLSDSYCKLAKELGLKLAISTDSHAATSLDFIRHGIDQALRGWLEADDVINTRSWSDLIGHLRVS